MMPNWWAATAAAVASSQPVEEDAEGGTLYPASETGNRNQARQSVYYGRNYAASPSQPAEPWGTGSTDDDRRRERMIAELAYYLMVKMEPTDRCLRMPGDIFDYKRLGPDGLEIREGSPDGA